MTNSLSTESTAANAKRLLFANIYWLWRWSQGVEKVTQGALSAVSALLLSWFLSAIGGVIIQSYFNKVSAA